MLAAECTIRATMNDVPFPFYSVVGFVVVLAGVVQLAWHVAVIVFLYKIWQKVRHLSN